MFRYVPNADLRLEDIPGPDAPMERIWDLVLTYNGYDHYEGCGQLARTVLVTFEREPERTLLQALTLSALRACLFMEYRRSSWDPEGCDNKWESYVRLIVDVIREKVKNRQFD